MDGRQAHSRKRPHRGVAWTLFGIVSALALGACVVADLEYGGGNHLVAVVVSGLTVIGVAAGLMASPPSRASDHARAGLRDGNNTGGWSAL